MRLIRVERALIEHTPILRPYADPNSKSARRLRWLVPAALVALCLPYGFYFALTAPFLIVPMMTPLAVLVALVVWALPETPNPPTRTMAALFSAFFVALLVWPNYIAIALPGLPWITLIRLFGTPMAILLLISISISAQFRQDLGAVLRTSPLVWMLLVGFVATQFWTIPLSDAVGPTTSKVVVSQILWTAVFFVSCYIFLKPGAPERWAIALCIIAVALGLLARVEFAEKRILWADSIPSFLKIEDAARYLTPAYRTATRIYRVKAVFGHPLIFAEFMALTMPFLIHFIMGPYRNFVRIGATAATLLLVNAIMLTDSRLGIIGALIAVTLYLLLWALLRWRRHRESLVAPAVLLAYPAFFVGAVAATFFVRRLKLMVWGGGAHQASDVGRDAQVQMGLPLIAANPIGHGAGQAAETLGFFGGATLTIDNYYLSVALEYGVLGFIFYYGMIIVAIYYSSISIIRTTKLTDRDQQFIIPATISLVSFFVIKSVFSQQDNHPLMFMLLGMVCALTYRSKMSRMKNQSKAQSRIR